MAATGPASWQALCLPSTSVVPARTGVPQFVDARPKGGHDGARD
jgi:hypothetical protein